MVRGAHSRVARVRGVGKLVSLSSVEMDGLSDYWSRTPRETYGPRGVLQTDSGGPAPRADQAGGSAAEEKAVRAELAGLKGMLEQALTGKD